jgi:hypothetical protein
LENVYVIYVCPEIFYKKSQCFDQYLLTLILSGSPVILVVTLPEWLTGSPAIFYATSGWALPASVRIAQVTLFFTFSSFGFQRPIVMSANKYATLPDIVRVSCCLFFTRVNTSAQDTAPDIYETDDVFPTSHPDVSFHFHFTWVPSVEM